MRFDSSIRWAFGVACAILLLGAVGFAGAVTQLRYFLMKEPIELRAAIDTLPSRLGRYQKVGDDRLYTKEIIEELGTTRYVDRTYALDGKANVGRIEVHVAYYTGTIDDVPHIPERCLNVHGYIPVGESVVVPLDIDMSAWDRTSGVFNRATGEEYPSTQTADPIYLRQSTVHMPVGDFKLRVTEFQSASRQGWRVIAGYLFIANGRVTPNAYGVRELAFSRTERYAYYCKVQLNIEGQVSEGSDSLLPEFMEQANEIMSAILPPLMARLPDWPAVESGHHPPSADGASDTSHATSAGTG